MPRKKATLPDIGDITLIKRRGAKNLRLSITASGEVRVSLPYFVPYGVGMTFAKSRLDWIQEHMEANRPPKLTDGARIGKSYRLHFKQITLNRTSVRVSDGIIEVSTGYPLQSEAVQKKASAGCHRALAAEAGRLLPQRLEVLARRYGFSYSGVKVRKLTSRWGSCSSDSRITLSYYLVQLPWHLIDYVLLHELVHTRHMDHTRTFWEEMARNLPSTPVLRKEIRAHKPRLEPFL